MRSNKIKGKGLIQMDQKEEFKVLLSDFYLEMKEGAKKLWKAKTMVCQIINEYHTEDEDDYYLVLGDIPIRKDECNNDPARFLSKEYPNIFSSFRDENYDLSNLDLAFEEMGLLEFESFCSEFFGKCDTLGHYLNSSIEELENIMELSLQFQDTEIEEMKSEILSGKTIKIKELENNKSESENFKYSIAPEILKLIKRDNFMPQY
jgi:hypothetical protein